MRRCRAPQTVFRTSVTAPSEACYLGASGPYPETGHTPCQGFASIVDVKATRGLPAATLLVCFVTTVAGGGPPYLPAPGVGRPTENTYGSRGRGTEKCRPQGVAALTRRLHRESSGQHGPAGGTNPNLLVARTHPPWYHDQPHHHRRHLARWMWPLRRIAQLRLDHR